MLCYIWAVVAFLGCGTLFLASVVLGFHIMRMNLFPSFVVFGHSQIILKTLLLGRAAKIGGTKYIKILLKNIIIS